MTHWLEGCFRIPGTKLRFGLDAVVGFFLPGWGDALTALASLWILFEAYRQGVPTRVLNKMLATTLFDLLLGAVPMIGDLADLFFRSNSRNMRALDALDLASNPSPMPKRAGWIGWLLLWGLGVVIMVIGIGASMAYFALSWLLAQFAQHLGG